ncbi:MAG: M48 family metallopeptidase [Gemmataceae bacterium]|nr:M48 family metallopeptidase [Gemmataceae bacterium]
MTQPASLTVDGVRLRLVVQRKRVRNVNARLRHDTLFVSAPPHVPEGILTELVADLARKLVRRVHARTVNRDEDCLALVRKIAARFPTKPEVARVEFVATQTRRWGSYSATTRTIRLNVALREMPRWVLEAVVAHELAHVTYPHHGPEFWTLLRSVYPDVDRADAFLAGVAWLAAGPKLSGVARALLGEMVGCDGRPAFA